MPDFGQYPVDFIMEEIRARSAGDSADDVEQVYSSSRDRIEEDAWRAYNDETEDPVSRQLFAQATERTFDALLGTHREDIKDKRAAAGMATADSTADDLREVIVWKPKEKMTGWMYNVEVVVDLSDPSEPSEAPLTVNTFYSVRSKNPLTHGEILSQALADFEAETDTEGSFPNQPVLGAIVTGVFHFERD